MDQAGRNVARCSPIYGEDPRRHGASTATSPIPNGSDGKKLPLIVYPHGGPYAVRDIDGFNPDSQFFASRGYAVLQMNFRGSGGYGTHFREAGSREWGGKMQDDVTDAVKSAVGEGIADAGRVCIFGASYGGYAALMGVVREPDLYRCTVGYAGVYDLDVQRTKSDTAQSECGRSLPERPCCPAPRPSATRSRRPTASTRSRPRHAGPRRQGRARADQEHVRTSSTANGSAWARSPKTVVVEKQGSPRFPRRRRTTCNLYTKMLAFFDKHIGARSTQSLP